MMAGLYTIALGFWLTLCAMAPYLLFGFLAAGVLSVLISPETVRRHLGGSGFWPVLKATLFGIPLPLCSCSVIPVAVSLRKHGASKGSSVGFLLSTPETGVDSILVTYGLLGPVFAVVRPIVALITGLVGGMLVEWLDPAPGTANGAPDCTDECCTGRRRNMVVRMLSHAAIELPRDIAWPLLVGLVIAGLIGALVPQDYFAGALGTGIVPMLVMMAVGIPLYVCSTASVPIATVLLAKGLTPGAVLVFLITGPATNAAGISAIWHLMGGRTAAIYLGSIALTALGSGLALDALFSFATARGAPVVCSGWHLPHWAGIATAFILLAVLAWAIARPLLHRHHHDCCTH